jgi:hypothetical protein
VWFRVSCQWKTCHTWPTVRRRHRAEPAGCSFAYERWSDSGNPLGWAAKGLGIRIGEMLHSDQSRRVRKYRPRSTTNPAVRKIWTVRRRRDLKLANNLKKGVPFATPVFDGAHEKSKSAACWTWRIRTISPAPGHDRRRRTRSPCTTAAPVKPSSVKSPWA